MKINNSSKSEKLTPYILYQKKINLIQVNFTQSKSILSHRKANYNNYSLG